MKKLLGFTFFSLILSLGLQAQAIEFPTKFVCVSNMNGHLELHETPINDYAMAYLTHSFEEWSFEADVIDTKINSLTLTHIPTGTQARNHSLTYPLNHLAVSLEVGGKKSTIDCDLRF